jgi:hypothetical protein
VSASFYEPDYVFQYNTLRACSNVKKANLTVSKFRHRRLHDAAVMASVYFILYTSEFIVNLIFTGFVVRLIEQVSYEGNDTCDFEEYHSECNVNEEFK